MKKTALVVFTVLVLLVSANRATCFERLDLMLDWFPNIDHLPVYIARDKGIFEEKGLKINILSPSETSDPIKLAATGKIDITIAYEPQVIIAASKGIPLTAGARLIRHPLSTLLYMENSGIEKPSDLEGKTIGYTVPGMMDLLFKAFAQKNGIEKFKMVNVGFSIVPSLVSGKVDAVMGPYKNYETVAMELEGYSTGFFPVEEWGIPDYDELVFITSRENSKKMRKELELFALSIEQAVHLIQEKPGTCLKTFLETIPERSRELESKAFYRTLDLYASDVRIDPEKWQKFADFSLNTGLIDEHVDTENLISNWRDMK